MAPSEQWLPVYKEFLAARDELTAAARRLLMSIMGRVDEHQ
jgi:nitrate reductase assembly molybdenum cofactor insertion protein NarJ